MESLSKDYVFVSSAQVNCDDLFFCKASLKRIATVENIHAETLLLCNTLVREHELLVTPHCLTRGQFGFLLAKKSYDQEFLHFLDKMNTTLLNMAEAQPYHIESCLRFAITRQMGTDWTCIGPWIVHCPNLSQLDQGKVHAVELDLKLQGEGEDVFCEVVAKTSTFKFHLITPEDVNPDGDQLKLMDSDPDWSITFQDTIPVYCFPQFNQGQVVEVSRNIPPWSPLRTYEDFVTYWKDLYCYQLPLEEEGQVYFTVKFSRNGAQYVYPSCCLCNRPPAVFRDANEPQAALTLFLQALKTNFPVFFEDLQIQDNIVLHKSVPSLATASQLPSPGRNFRQARGSKEESGLNKRRLPNVSMMGKLVDDLDKEKSQPKPKVPQPTCPTTLVSPYFSQGSTEAVNHIPSILLARTKTPAKKLALLDCRTAQQQQPKSKPRVGRSKVHRPATTKTLTDYFPVKKIVNIVPNDVSVQGKEKPYEKTDRQKYDIVSLALHGQLSKVPLANLQNWLKQENVPFFIKAKRDELIQLVTKRVHEN